MLQAENPDYPEFVIGEEMPAEVWGVALGVVRKLRRLRWRMTALPPFALIDCNNFYVSCERMFDRRLEGVSVLVLSNNDGCAINRSQEVKAFGIKMGAPAFTLKDLIRQHGIRVFSSNYTLYGT